MKKALLIIDVQNDYFPNGACELYQSKQALEKIKSLLSHFRKNELPVYFIQHIADKTASFFVPDTEGAEIHEAIAPLASEKVIIKHFPNSFFETPLQEELEKDSVTELIVCGMMTHMCVDTTVRTAKDFGYPVTLISDACATKDLELNNKRIPAQIVQDVYMASLHPKFANVMTCDNFYTRVEQGENR